MRNNNSLVWQDRFYICCDQLFVGGCCAYKWIEFTPVGFQCASPGCLIRANKLTVACCWMMTTAYIRGTSHAIGASYCYREVLSLNCIGSPLWSSIIKYSQLMIPMCVPINSPVDFARYIEIVGQLSWWQACALWVARTTTTTMILIHWSGLCAEMFATINCLASNNNNNNCYSINGGFSCGKHCK